MKRWILILAMLLIPTGTLGQTAAVNGYCNLGAAQAVTSGLDSSNYLQGIVPNCTVMIYYTGTTNLVPGSVIYSNSTGTILGNPFTANTDGSWLFYALTGIGYDIVLSGGNPVPVSPFWPKTLTDVFAGGGGGGGGVQYPTSNTLFAFYGESRFIAGNLIVGSTNNYIGNLPMQFATQPFINKGGANSGTLTITSCQISGSNVATVTYTGTPEPYVGQIVQISGLSSPNCSPLNSATSLLAYNVLATGLTGGSFSFDFISSTVLSTPDSGTATLYGNVVNLSIPGGTTASAISGYAANVHPFSPAATGNPGFIIDEFGAQDVMNGTSVATIEANMQSLWKTYRADGWTILRLSLSPAYSLIGCGPDCYPNEMAINDWLYGQNATPTNIAANAGYYDRLVDIAQILNNNGDSYLFSDGTHYSSAGDLIGAAWINAALTNQNTVPASNYVCSAPLNYCAATNNQNHWTVKQWFDNPTVWEDPDYDRNPMDIGLWPNQAGDDYFPFIAGIYRGIYSHWDFEEDNVINEILEGTSQLCWVNYYGGPDWDRMKAGTIGLTIDASGNWLNVGDCSTSAAGHYNMPIRAAGLQSGGTKFTASGCGAGTTVGGATAGSIALGANNCSLVVTLNGATGLSASNGWSCHANDETSPTVMIPEASSTTATVTFAVPNTAGSSDTIDFECTGY